jgi:Chaperone of endosialidase
LTLKKTLLLTTALTLGASSIAFAGGMAEPVMEPAVVETQTSSSSGGVVVALLLLLVIAAAASGGGGGGGAAPSDIRLKEDVTRVGTTHLGLPLYQYRYKGMPGVWEGVMAQDVEIMHPNAIKPLPYGFKAVDYASLGLTLRRVH